MEQLIGGKHERGNSMKFLALIQARFASTRLPGKILMDLSGKPALQRVIERVEQCKYVDEAMVITSLSKDDVNTVKLVSSLGKRVFAGSEQDVLDRYYQSAKLIAPEYVIRITADCPVFDPKMLDLAIENLDPKSDYMSAITETLADGLDLEIFKFSALKSAWENAKLASEREHVTLFIRNNPKTYSLQNFECPLGNLNHERWTVDEPEDFELVSKIYEHFSDTDFYTEDILKFLDENPSLRQLNSKFARNEGLAKSLANDYIVSE